MTTQTVELLQQLIRNACVNDGTPDSGQEQRNAETLTAFLDGPGLDLATFEPHPARTSVVARIEGTDPGAPRLLFLGHTDVVPADPTGWQRDPFGGELVDGEVWGRGAVDMLNQTASMAVAMRQLADSGFRPRGDLVFVGVADEEGGGTWGADWLLEHEREAVYADYVLTETGGMSLPLGTPERILPVMVAEKGVAWVRLRVSGTPGHASMTLATDNALVNAAAVVHRLQAYEPRAEVGGVWRDFVDACGLPEPLSHLLLDGPSLDAFCQADGTDQGLARLLHASTRLTIAPTMVRGGVKTNVIPEAVDLTLDLRTLPGQTREEIEDLLLEIAGPELAARVEVSFEMDNAASASSVDTPLFDSLSRVTKGLVPNARTVPFLLVGITDARFYRRAGATAYGYGLFSDRISMRDFAAMFHGHDERIDVESLRLTTELWADVARDFGG